MTERRICIVNRSPDVSAAEAFTMAAICAKQLREHVAPAWGLTAPHVRYAVDELHVVDGEELVAILRDADTAGALGYHDVSPLGQPYAKVFTADTLANGGTVMSSSLSVCVTMSHELAEMLGDPLCNEWVRAPDGYEYAKELADACEASAYNLDGFPVSDFLLPGFFGHGGACDYLGKVPAPFVTIAGGYQIRRDPRTGDVTQVFGESRGSDDWRAAAKAHVMARTARRLATKGMQS